MEDFLRLLGVPLAHRTFLGTLFGNRGDITEKSLTKEELQTVATIIARTRQARDQSPEQQGQRFLGIGEGEPNRVGYSDYNISGAKTLPRSSSPNQEESILNTLGRFGYEIGPDGRIKAKDKYDFDNDVRRSDVEKYEKLQGFEKLKAVLQNASGRGMGVWDMLKNPETALADEIGNAYIGRQGGRNVNINFHPSNLSTQEQDPIRQAIRQFTGK